MVKKLLIGLGVLLVLFVGFATWYTLYYSMAVIEGFEKGDKNAAKKVLIASQGSEFKEELVDMLTKKLDEKSVYVKVVDVTKLGEEKAADWNAIVLIHTIEMYDMPDDVKTFLNTVKNKKKIFAFATSGQGDMKPKEVVIDTLTSASKKVLLPQKSEEIIAKLSKIVGVQF